MTTPFDNGPANPFTDNSQPAQPAQQSTAGEPTNPFANVPVEQPTQQPTNTATQPTVTDPFGPTSTQPTAFAAPQATNAFGGNSGNGRKYKIFDLYWLVNLKLYKNEQLAPNEVAVLNISYNIDFDNLRFTFCTPGADTFSQTGMELKSMDRKTTVNICAEVAEQLADLIIADESGQVNNLERVFQNNSNWAPNQTVFTKNGNLLSIATNTKNGESYNYTFSEWQLKALTHACSFLIKEARILTLSKMGIG